MIKKTIILFLWVVFYSSQILASDEMVSIPGGPFIMGSDKIDTEGLAKRYGARTRWYVNEHPQHELIIASFSIDKFEVTNADYRKFIVATGGQVTRYWVETGYALSINPDLINRMNREQLLDALEPVDDKLKQKMDNDIESLRQTLKQYWRQLDQLPMMYVTWSNAQNYCHWVGKRLPKEAEWEKAARGTQGNEFTWGIQWQKSMANTGDESWPYFSAPGGSYSQDKSVYGVFDLTGNVQEWVADWYQAYPGATEDDPDYGLKHKVIRGASFGGTGHYALAYFQRGAYRSHAMPDFAMSGLGFRCAK